MIASVTADLGQTLTFQGYAIDYGKRITQVQFSLDEGEHWTAYDTPEATDERWVHWTFSYKPARAGAYRLRIRSVNEDGCVSPESAWTEFFVN